MCLPAIAPTPTPPTRFTHVDIARLLWLREEKINACGLAPIYLRVTVSGQRTEISTGVRCRPADWTGAKGQKGELRRSHPEYQEDQDTLNELYVDAKKAFKQLEATGAERTAANVAKLLKNPKLLHPGAPACLLAFMEAELNIHYEPGNRGTYETMRNIVRKLRAWHGPARLPLSEFPPTRALAFYRHLLSAKVRGGEIANANKVVIKLTALFRRGIKQALWSEGQNPFTCIEKKPALKLQKVRLTAEEQQRVALVALNPAEWLWRGRAVYLTQFYLRGERIGAVLLLQWADLHQGDAVLRYQAQKGGPFKQVPVRPELQRLLTQLAPRRAAGHRYILPFLPDAYPGHTPEKQLQLMTSSTAVVNKALKAVAALAGVDKPLRSHAARHTFATVAAAKVGVRAVQQMLGHTNLKMTEVYLAGFDSDEMNAAADAAFDSL